MDRSAAIFGLAMFGITAALTSIASQKVGKPDVNSAVAAAIRGHMGQWMEPEVLYGGDPTLGPFTLCAESKIPLQIDAVAHELSETIIRPVPISDCTSETIAGDFGMFTALTSYYDSAGEEAAHLKVVGIACTSTRMCVVDIDDHGSGMRYEIERQGKEWAVKNQTMRWIV